MKRKCDKCNKPATHHCVKVVGGKKIEKHLCDVHAAEDPDMMARPADSALNSLLNNFVKSQSDEPNANAPIEADKSAKSPTDQTCEVCGLTFAQFRERGLLGCGHCYDAFEPLLTPLLERAHEGGAQHLGKTPRRAGSGDNRQLKLSRLRKRLDDAVAAEDYELAAHLRDEIGRIAERQPS